jgi:hypothetical protein
MRYLSFGGYKKNTGPSSLKYVNTGIEFKKRYCLGSDSENYLVFLDKINLGNEQPNCLKGIYFIPPTAETRPRNKNPSKTMKLRDGYGLCPIPKILEEPGEYNLRLVPENDDGVISCQVESFSSGLTLLAKNRHGKKVRERRAEGWSSSDRVEHPTTKRKFEGEASINSVNQMGSSRGQQLEEHGEVGIGTDIRIAGQTQSMDPELFEWSNDYFLTQEWPNDYHPTLDWL